MSNFEWKQAANSFSNFGGQEKTLRIPKTGLPFFDVLRLYGAIELFIGLQQEVFIHDAGSDWEVRARIREQRLKDLHPVARTLKKKDLSKGDEKWIQQLREALFGSEWPTQPLRNVSLPLDNPDSALKDGVRDTAAATYKGLESGYGKESKVPFADALLAYAGQKRTEAVAEIYFLPIFEGRVDYSKVVSPLRAWMSIPNVLCAQALTLLALKTSLFAEGYAEKLGGVVYNRVRKKASDSYSGVIEIESTALGKDGFITPEFVTHFYETFRSLVRKSWPQGSKGKSEPEVEDAFAHAYWLMQPSSPKHLGSLITSLERQRRNDRPCIIVGTRSNRSYVKEVFQMSYGKWEGDHEAVRKYAKVVASAIYHLWKADIKGRALSEDERRKSWGKTWYDNVVMLRSAPTAKSFFERAQIMIEQGKKENQFIGSMDNEEDFDPVLLLKSVGNNRAEFETFRDLFRMYLVQESSPRSVTK